MKRFVLFLGLFLASAAACAPVDGPATVTKEAVYPYSPPVAISPAPACSGPAWDEACDLIAVVPEAKAFADAGYAQCRSCSDGVMRRLQVPVIHGWLTSREEASAWFRAYRFPVTWLQDEAAFVCDAAVPFCEVVWNWPTADGSWFQLSVAFRNASGHDPARGSITRLQAFEQFYMPSDPRPWYTRVDALYSLPNRTTTYTAARRVLYQYGSWDAQVSRISPPLFEAYQVWF